MPPEKPSRIAENLDAVRERIARAAVRSGRDSSAVCLVAVTKYARPAWVRDLVKLGVRSLGESRPQQFAERIAAIDGSVDWHFIGHLQRNKVRMVVPHAALIHSIDSLRLLERVNQVAAEAEIASRVLIEVNVSGEATKQGFTPETIEQEWAELTALQPVRIVGLMTMAPASEDPEEARPFFRALRNLRDRLAQQSPPGVELPELSMGMSGDFDVAIEEGATLIRVGSALFEGMIP